jgi:exodeoxyribonuclease III
MQIISYNVNGIRAAMTKGFVEWLEQTNPDVICLQEVKAMLDQVDLAPIEALGYHIAWHAAEKKGYSGTATFSKMPPTHLAQGVGLDEYDREGRILRTDFDDLTLLNCYFPSGTSGDERQGFKMEYLNRFFDYVQQLRLERPNLIIVGDYNIAHNEIDIHDPKGNKNSTGFLPEERAWMSRWFASGFTDAYRALHPQTVAYSWWSYRAGARGKNKGWRIDYQSISTDMAERVTGAGYLPDAMHSDHCPMWITVD